LQRLPWGTIERAQISCKILLQKHPAAANLGPWNAARSGAFAQFFGVQVQEAGGFGQR